MGTYDLTGNCVNNLTFKNCVQSNFWITMDENYVIRPAKASDEGAMSSMASCAIEGVPMQLHWGIGGSNFCKNLTYDGSTLSRFDAHCGLYNGKIINSNVNAVALTGKGEFVIENTTWYSASNAKNVVVAPRSDYGSVWDGSITIKDLKAYIRPEAGGALVSVAYYNWYYGYPVAFPEMRVDNITFYDVKTKEPLAAGTEIEFLERVRRCIYREPTPHLATTVKIHPDYPDVDDDGDGLVDGTNIPYDDVVSKIGVIDESSNKNLNVVTPPSEIIIKGNEGARKPGKCTFVVYDTSKAEGVSDGGFFGNTKFITDGSEYLGTDYVGKETETYVFRELNTEGL